MGFLEDLRRSEADRQAQSRRFHEGLRQAAQDREREEVESKRRLALRSSALSSSIVPSLATQVGSLIHGKVSHNERMGSIIVSFGQDESNYISVEGREDGSVRIGNMILSARDSQNSGKVEKALEKAYRSPDKFSEPVGPPEGCGS